MGAWGHHNRLCELFQKTQGILAFILCEVYSAGQLHARLDTKLKIGELRKCFDRH